MMPELLFQKNDAGSHDTLQFFCYNTGTFFISAADAIRPKRLRSDSDRHFEKQWSEEKERIRMLQPEDLLSDEGENRDRRLR